MLGLSELLEEDLGAFAQTTQETSETPFPQANSLDRILDLVKTVRLTGVEQSVFIETGVVNNARQADYYANAAIYLALVKKVGERYYPTGMGVKLQNLTSRQEQCQMLAAIALAHPTIGMVYSSVFMFATEEERKKMIMTTVDMGRNVLAQATLKRRADGVYAWLVWIQKHLVQL